LNGNQLTARIRCSMHGRRQREAEGPFPPRLSYIVLIK